MGCPMPVFMANTFMFYRTEPLTRSPPPGLIFFKRYIDDFAGAYNDAAEAIPPLFVDVIDVLSHLQSWLRVITTAWAPAWALNINPAHVDKIFLLLYFSYVLLFI